MVWKLSLIGAAKLKPGYLSQTSRDKKFHSIPSTNINLPVKNRTSHSISEQDRMISVDY